MVSSGSVFVFTLPYTHLYAIMQDIRTCMKNSDALHRTISSLVQTRWDLNDDQIPHFELIINSDKNNSFGDLSCNVAMILAKTLKQNPKIVANQLIEQLEQLPCIARAQNAGPGFINLFLTRETLNTWAHALHTDGHRFFINPETPTKSYLIELVSANPTGPLHLGHGRGGIIGDVIGRVLTFLGNTVTREYYINDAGNQIAKLSQSLKARCFQLLGHQKALPEGGYAGEYLVDIARTCVEQEGKALTTYEDTFFSTYAQKQILALIKKTLTDYRITIDTWFSEKKLYDQGAVEHALGLLATKGVLFEQDGAQWFRATAFGDSKDRVIKKSDGTLTYIAGDIAYHKDKCDRGYDCAIDVLGQDHHGYVTRLKATMKALGYNANMLHVILYQLVSITRESKAVRMSKRAGTFTHLQEIIDTVGADCARFFYLHRKAEAHLCFDLETALKKNEENPVYYIHYAYVRTHSLLEKAEAQETYASFLTALERAPSADDIMRQATAYFGDAEYTIVKKILSLQRILYTIALRYQPHLLSYYTLELAQMFHHYYAHHTVIDTNSHAVSISRLFMVRLMNQTLETCLDLLGLSKPKRM